MTNWDRTADSRPNPPPPPDDDDDDGPCISIWANGEDDGGPELPGLISNPKIIKRTGKLWLRRVR